MGVRIEGVVASIDSVEVHVSVKKHVEPEGIREIRTVGPDDEVIFSSSSINDVVGFESKSTCDIWVEDTS